MPPKEAKSASTRLAKSNPPIPPEESVSTTRMAPPTTKPKKSALGVRAAIEEAQLLGTDSIDDYETSKTALRSRKAVMDEDRRAVQDLERWSGPQFAGGGGDDF